MRTLFNFSIFASTAMVAVAIAALPVAAKDRGSREEAGSQDPMTIVVSLRNQKAHIYRGLSLITSTSVSTGKRGHATKAGVYSILEKRRRHYSNLYNGAPMPWMQRLTWTGTALHAGAIPGYPASHGCIRLPYSFAPKLFSMTQVGAQVVVANTKVTPEPISHPALFQPVPPPMPPSMPGLAREDETRGPLQDARQEKLQDQRPLRPMRKSRLERIPGQAIPEALIFAKAEAVPARAQPLGMIETPRPPLTVTRGANSQTGVGLSETRTASLEDTNFHAIDPSAAPFANRLSDARDGTDDDTADASDVFSDDITGAIAKHSDRLKHAERLKHQDQLKHEERLRRQTPKSANAATKKLVVEAVPAPAVKKSDVTKSAALMDEAAPLKTAPQADNPYHVGPILNVSATALAGRAREPLAVSLSVLGVNDHPPVPLLRPSVMLSKLTNGAARAAVQAAEPISPEPLRILITRRTTRDRTVDIQYMLSDMGFLAPQNFDGTRGSATVRALKAFQKANDMPVTGAFTDDVMKKVYEIAGKKQPPEGQLFVRQKFKSVFSVPVSFTNPDKPLGTHLFTVMHFESGSTEADWTAISLNDKENARTVLDRIEIPEDLRQRISERLTPGSSLIVADTAINSAALPTGADFLVWDTSQTPKVQYAKPKRRVTRQRTASSRQRAAPNYRRAPSRQRYSRRSPPRRSFFPF